MNGEIMIYCIRKRHKFLRKCHSDLPIQLFKYICRTEQSQKVHVGFLMALYTFLPIRDNLAFINEMK